MRTYKKTPVFKYNCSVEKNVVLLEKPVMSELFVETIELENGRTLTHYGNDVTLLFNQQRIDKLSTNPTEAVNAWLSSLAKSKTDPLAELRSKCTDEQLIEVVKSRHIQSPSELIAWSSWLNDNVDSVLADIAKQQSDSDDNGNDDTGGTPPASE